MSWERRKRGGWYYARSRREGGRVVREYLGCGELAQLFAALDDEKRQERAAERTEREAERAPPLARERVLADLGSSLDALVRATMEAGGYHLHRGQWRRKRDRASRTNG